MSEWQPIETAPRDGTWVLLCGGQTTEDDYNDEGVRKLRPVVAFWEAPRWDGDEGHWNFCYWDGDWGTGYDSPTHWMLLPPMPAKAPMTTRRVDGAKNEAVTIPIDLAELILRALESCQTEEFGDASLGQVFDDELTTDAYLRLHAAMREYAPPPPQEPA